MKRIFSLLLALTLLFSLVACSYEPIEIEKTGGLRTPEGDYYPEDFLILDGESVPFTHFRYLYLNYRDKYLAEDPDYFKRDGAEEELKTQVLDYLKQIYTVMALADEYGVALTEEERAEIATMVESAMSSEEDAAAMNASYMPRSLFHYMSEYSALFMKLFDTLFAEEGPLAWTNEEYFRYYQDHYLAVQQIYLPYQEGENRESCPQTREQMDAIVAELGEGEDFWRLVEKYCADEMMLDYPDGYYITVGQCEYDLWVAAKALALHQVSEPVAGESGLYLMRRLPLKETEMLKNKDTTLFGYTDSFNVSHTGVYDEEFYNFYTAEATKIKVETSPDWDKIRHDTVY